MKMKKKKRWTDRKRAIAVGGRSGLGAIARMRNSLTKRT
jgi:hypothetical protein